MADDTEEDNPRDVERFNRLAQQMAVMVDVRAAIGHFLADFAVFESIYLTAALKAVSYDATVIEHLPELMDLRNRLKLLKYLGTARQLSKQLMDDVISVRSAASQLSEFRNEIAHNAAMLSMPFLTDPDSSDIVAGVQRPRSKWIVSSASIQPDEVMALHRKWMIPVDRIRECTEAAVQLQRATNQLATKLDCYKRNEPWEHMTVAKVSVPKQA